MNTHQPPTPLKSAATGYTLTELLIAAAIMSVVVAVAGAGLITILDLNAKNEAQTKRRQQLRRALNFISNDIKEAFTISLTRPSRWDEDISNAYQPIFYLEKPTPSGTADPAVVAYYMRPKSFNGTDVVWQSPQIIYRLDQSDPGEIAVAKLTNVGQRGDALVDAISTNTPTCDVPVGTGPSSPESSPENVGLQIHITDQKSAKVCLAGATNDGDITLEAQVFARAVNDRD